MDGRDHDGHDRFSHEALFYRDADEFLAGVLDFARPGLEAGERVVAAVPPRSLRLLRSALADGEVRLIDMSELGRNPARIIPAVRDLIVDEPMRFVGEPIWPGRSEAEIREATRHEALINLAWSEAPLRVLCPYDAAGLDDDVLVDAAHTHPLLRDADEAWTSRRYGGHAAPASCEEALERPPVDAEVLTFGLDELSDVRALVARRGAHMPSARADDLVLAVNELAGNALRHGGERGRLSVWSDDGALLCEVAGRGALNDPLAGRRRPGADWHESRGLWIVNQLCDLVQARNDPGGLTVRVLMRP